MPMRSATHADAVRVGGGVLQRPVDDGGGVRDAGGPATSIFPPESQKPREV